jgi:hypothetical protein
MAPKKQTKSRATPKKAKPATKKPATKKVAKGRSAAKKAAPRKAVAKKAAPKRRAAKKSPVPRKPRVEVAAEAVAPIEVIEPISDAIPNVVFPESSNDSTGRRLLTARDRMTRSSPVVEILDDPHPIGALRRFLDSLKGTATPQQAQIALGSAQLILLPIAHDHRGGSEVKELVDLMLQHWSDFGERRRGFHAQEFLRNAFAAIGVDRDRIARLEQLVPPGASAELMFNLACAHAVARDKVAMMRAVERAIEAGASPSQFRRDPDFAVYARDPDLAHVLSRAEVPLIPVDVEPQVGAVRAALDMLFSTLKEFGEPIEVHPPVRLDAILDAERAARISLPNDYRALLTITNGMHVWEHTFFGAGDYREPTPLAVRARQYQQMSASYRAPGIEDCIPIANCGQPTDWILYDPRGHLRGGEPGYVLMLDADELPLPDLATALTRIEYLARETLGTN